MQVAKWFHKKCWAAFVFKGSVTSIGSIQLWRAICQLLVWNKQENQSRNIQLCSTLFQLKGKSRGGYWALFNFIPNKDEDVGLEYQQTHWDQPNTCLKPEPADWFTACLNRDIPGKEEKGYLRKRGKEVCQEKRKRGIEEKRNRGKEISLEKRISTFSTTHAHVFTSAGNLAKRNHLINQDDLKKTFLIALANLSLVFTGSFYPEVMNAQKSSFRHKKARASESKENLFEN